MKVFGLYAGVGAGKSTVAKAFAALGAVVLDADAYVHEAYRDAAIRQQVTARFGEKVYRADGTLDREALGAVVFADPSARKELEAIVHPFARQRTHDDLQAAIDKGIPAAILDVPLLAASPLQELVEVGIFIDAPLATRERRAQTTRSWPVGEVARRDALQTPLAEKQAFATHVIDNGPHTSPADVDRQVRAIWQAEIGTRPAGSDSSAPSSMTTPSAPAHA